jgi:hypothetical protein
MECPSSLPNLEVLVVCKCRVDALAWFVAAFPNLLHLVLRSVDVYAKADVAPILPRSLLSARIWSTRWAPTWAAWGDLPDLTTLSLREDGRSDFENWQGWGDASKTRFPSLNTLETDFWSWTEPHHRAPGAFPALRIVRIYCEYIYEKQKWPRWPFAFLHKLEHFAFCASIGCDGCCLCFRALVCKCV